MRPRPGRAAASGVRRRSPPRRSARPSSTGASRRRTVSTSGSSGTRPPYRCVSSRRLRAAPGARPAARRRARYAASTLRDGLVGLGLGARVHLGELVARPRPAFPASRGRRCRPRDRRRRPWSSARRRGAWPRCRCRSRRARARTPAAGAATARITGATGSADSSEVPPCASIQRRQTVSALPSATAASARRRPSASSIPRSESASSLPHASSTSSVKSAGPWPRTVSSASWTSRALPTAAPSGWSMSVSRQTTSRPACRPSEIIVSASSRASSSVFMNAPSPTFTSSTIAWAPAGELLRHDRRGDQRAAGRRSP